MMSITPPDRIRSPSPEMEELHRRPLTLWEVLDLSEDMIEHLPEDQIADSARYINQNRMTLIHELHSNLGACSYELQDKLLALADNPYIKRDQTLMEFLVRTSDFVGQQAIHEGYKETRRQTQATIERSERNQKAFEERQAKAREEQARHNAEQAIADRAFQERNREFEEREKVRREEQRLLFEQIARRDAEAEAARERERQEQAAAQQADYRPLDDYAPDHNDNDGWTNCFKITAVIAGIAAIYAWLKGRGNPPKGE